MSELKSKLKYKRPAKHVLEIPLGRLDRDLRYGRDVYEWLMKECRNSAMYNYRGRGRGKGWKRQNDLPIDDAERVALYATIKDEVYESIEYESGRYESALEVKIAYDDYKNARDSHNENYPGDLD